MTMNGAVLPVLAMYIVAAEEQVLLSIYPVPHVTIFYIFFSFVYHLERYNWQKLTVHAHIIFYLQNRKICSRGCLQIL